MNDQLLIHYSRLLSKLNRSKSFGGAPHKPVLLLAVISLVERGEILRPQIEITPELVLEFKEIWEKVVDTPHTPNFALPFFHMKREPFWRLITKTGLEIPVTSSGSIKSLAALQESLAYAEIDEVLFYLLQVKENRLFLQQQLLDQYFPHMKNRFFQSEDGSLFRRLESQILTDDQQQYAQRIEALRHQLTKEEFQEEVYVRGGVFKREIPRIYRFQCAVSGMRVQAFRNIQMIDACHIVPFALSKNDTITNGISLSPNLHRAFDRGLITINDDYTVVVTTKIIESSSPYALSQFDGKRILLPENQKYHPDPGNLHWHRKERFVG